MPGKYRSQPGKAVFPAFLSAALLIMPLLAPGASGQMDRPGPPAVRAEETLPAGQFLPADLDGRAGWEEYLRAAEIVGSDQKTGRGAVTRPWVLTLEKDGLRHRAIWKNPSGLMGGFWEGWQYEIAAYLLDKHLGIGMVPPTVERRFRNEKGSCQLWVEDCLLLEEKQKKKMKVPPARVGFYNRAVYLQRFFDNLIANEDRHSSQILITGDWRMLLIDHSRSFRTAARFTDRLLYNEKNPEGPKLMRELPRSVVDRARALDRESLKRITAGYLDDKEIAAVLARRDLIMKEIEKLIRIDGEDQVLY